MSKKRLNKKVKHQKFICKGDKVVVIAGNDKGMSGEVLSRTDDRIIVQGINICKKHVKPSQQYQQGGIIELEKSIHISNVMFCAENETPVKINVSMDSAGNRELSYTQSGNKTILRSVKKRKA